MSSDDRKILDHSSATTRDNIVRVDFANAPRPARKPSLHAKTDGVATVAAFKIQKRLSDRLRRFDVTAPWVIRLVAVALVLLLSMLVL